MKISKKKKFLFVFVAPFVLILILTAITRNQSVATFAIGIWYAILLGWVVYGYILWVKWIARTAENAGRSYKGFLVLGIFLPVIASIIVLTFKQAGTSNKAEFN